MSPPCPFHQEWPHLATGCRRLSHMVGVGSQLTGNASLDLQLLCWLTCLDSWGWMLGLAPRCGSNFSSVFLIPNSLAPKSHLKMKTVGSTWGTGVRHGGLFPFFFVQINSLRHSDLAPGFC